VLKVLAQMILFSTSVLKKNFMNVIVLRGSFACLCLQTETRSRGLFVPYWTYQVWLSRPKESTIFLHNASAGEDLKAIEDSYRFFLIGVITVIGFKIKFRPFHFRSEAE
jgi:uncharacterized radical SAM superfamily protein